MALAQELRLQLRRAVPVITASLCRRSIDVMTVAVLGHLGKEELASGALALSTTATVAYSVFVGLSGATTTLVSQAIGAGDREQAALWLQRAVVVHVCVAAVLTSALTWLGPLLRLMGQQPELARAAGAFGNCLLPSVWAWAMLWALIPWLQAQGIFKPQTAVATVVAAAHPLFLYTFVYVLGGGALGGALANSLSLSANVILVALTVFTFRRRLGTLALPPLSRASVTRLGTYLTLGVPGVLMMGEWWASEINILLGGWLPDPTLSLAALSCYQNINGLCFMPAVGASVAGATRVGAALGSGDAPGAKRAAQACVVIGASVSTLVAALLLMCRHAVAAALTNDADVQLLLASQLLPPLALYVIADALQYCCNGILQGCGLQKYGAPIVLVVYYLIGIPLAAGLGFGARMGAHGMVVGMTCAKVCHAAAFGALVARISWQAQVERAAKRVADERGTSTLNEPPTATEPPTSVGGRKAALCDALEGDDVPWKRGTDCAAEMDEEAAEEAAGEVTGGAAEEAAEEGAEGPPNSVEEQARHKAKGVRVTTKKARRYAPLDGEA